jgi:uncharacterized membrane protein YkoI
MMNHRAITSVLLSAIFAITLPATVAQAGLRSAAAAPVSNAEHVSRAHLTAFEQAKVSLGDAVSITESTMGGIVIDANFQVSNGRLVYVVKAFLHWDKPAADRSMCEETIDAQEGSVIAKGKAIPQGMLDQENQSKLSGLHPWYASLGEAVTAAEDYSHGKAISARLTERKGHSIFEVMTVKDASVINVAVDAADGHVVS